MGKKTKAKPYKEFKEAPPLAIVKSMGAKIFRVGYRGVYTVAKQERLKLQPPQSFLNFGKIIGKTRCAKVFRATLNNGMEVAIKVCCKPSTKLSANMWRNEVDILYKLDYIGTQIFIIIT